MAIAAVFQGAGMTKEKYDEVVAAAGPVVWDQPGRSHHVCYETPAGLNVVDVWDSPEAFERFGAEVIGPAIAAAGIDFPPTVYPVVNEHRGGGGNVATVAAMYEAFGRGDIPAILDRLVDDVDWEAGRTDDHGVPWLRPGRGKDHVAAFFGTLQVLEFKRFEPKLIVGDGDTVLALIDLEAVVLETGGVIDDREVHIWTFGTDGRVTSLRHVVDTAMHARALAG